MMASRVTPLCRPTVLRIELSEPSRSGLWSGIAIHFGGPCDAAIADTGYWRDARPIRRGGFSCDGQDFVANEVKANLAGERPVEEEGRRCFNCVLSQLIPGISLGKNVFGKALGAVASIGFLDNLEYQFGHISSIRHEKLDCQAAS